MFSKCPLHLNANHDTLVHNKSSPTESKLFYRSNILLTCVKFARLQNGKNPNVAKSYALVVGKTFLLKAYNNSSGAGFSCSDSICLLLGIGDNSSG